MRGSVILMVIVTVTIIACAQSDYTLRVDAENCDRLRLEKQGTNSEIDGPPGVGG